MLLLQVILLEESWSELFVLCAVQWSMPMDTSPLFAVADQMASSHTGEHGAGHVVGGVVTSGASPVGGGGGVLMGGAKSGHQVHSDMRILQEITARFKSLQVDPAEFACHKAIVLFKPGIKAYIDLGIFYCIKNLNNNY